MKKNSYSYDDLITCGNGELFGPGNAKLPLPPMLMFDRITNIQNEKGKVTLKIEQKTPQHLLILENVLNTFFKEDIKFEIYFDEIDESPFT